MKESYVQGAILEWLAAVRVLAFRMNTGAAVSEYNGRKRIVRYGVAGMADIQAFPRGCVLWIECKGEGGRQSAEQKSFQAQVEEHGHRYIIARSVEDVESALNELRVV